MRHVPKVKSFCKHRCGEPGWDRTIDHLINVPPRLSSPLASLQSGLSLHRSKFALGGCRQVSTPSHRWAWLGIVVAITRTSSPNLTPSHRRFPSPMAPLEVKCSTTELPALSSPDQLRSMHFTKRHFQSFYRAYVHRFLRPAWDQRNGKISVGTIADSRSNWRKDHARGGCRGACRSGQ